MRLIMIIDIYCLIINPFLACNKELDREFCYSRMTDFTKHTNSSLSSSLYLLSVERDTTQDGWCEERYLSPSPILQKERL